MARHAVLIVGYLIAAATLLAACEKIVEVDLPRQHEPQLVAICLFNPDQDEWVVSVGHTLGILDTTSLRSANIDDATVEIFEDGGAAVRLRGVGYGRYVSNEHPPRPGTRYILRVTSPEFGTVTATDVLPESTYMIEASLVDGGEAYGSGPAEARMRLRFQDSAGGENFYHPYVLADHGSGLRRVSYSTPEQESEEEAIDRLDLVSNITGSGFQMSFSGLYMKDEGFNGGIGEVTMTFDRAPSNGYAGGLEIMSESYFRYLQSLMILEEIRGNPFAEPARAFSNIEGGLGIFAGSIHQRGEPISMHEVTAETMAGMYGVVAFHLGRPPWLNVLGSGGSLKLQLYADGRVEGRLILPAEANSDGVESETDLDGTFTYDGSEVRFSFGDDVLLEESAWEYDAAQGTLRTSGPDRDSAFIVLRKRP